MGSDAIGMTQADAERDRYFELVRAFPLRPIRADEELDRAVEIIDSLIVRGDLDPSERDYLDILGDIVERYEAEEHPIAGVSDAEMLRHLIGARGEEPSRVAADTGIAESTIPEILAGERGLNRQHIGALTRHFHVSPAVFTFD